jgi:hypothetical protein
MQIWKVLQVIGAVGFSVSFSLAFLLAMEPEGGQHIGSVILAAIGSLALFFFGRLMIRWSRD